jgi:hypothetical protein
MQTKVKAVSEGVAKILEAGSVAYVPGGIAKFENGQTFAGDCFALDVIELRREVRVQTANGRAALYKPVDVMVVDAAGQDWRVTRRLSQVKETGEYCIPVRELSLHWTDGDRYDAARVARQESAKASEEYGRRQAARNASILRQFAAVLDVKPYDWSIGDGKTLRYSGLDTDKAHGGITISFDAFKTLCAKLGIDPDAQ